MTVNESVSQFSNCRYISKKEFARTDNTYTIDIEAEGVFGIDYAYQSGENVAEIYVDGELYAAPTVTFDYDFSQRHILIVSDECSVNKNIQIKFATQEQADGFEGIAFSWE